VSERRTYSELLRDPRWQRKKNGILIRDDYRCVWCKDTARNQQVDHKRYIKGRMPWEYSDSDLQTLCEVCHGRITILRRKAAEAIGEFNVYELPAVIAAIERMGGREPSIVDAPEPALVERPWVEPPTPEVPSRPVMSAADLDALEREKRILISQPWTSAASRRVEELDEMTGTFWDSVGLSVCREALCT
jgi:hypothetical protein